MNLLIAVEGCEAHRDRWEAQRNTWCLNTCPIGPFWKWIEIRFFDGPMLGVPDDYRSLPQKTKAICQWALHRGHEYLFKADTDLYLHVPRLLASGSEKHDYTGYLLDYMKDHPYCSGPHYWLSRKAMEILAGADWDQYAVSGLETCEDVMVGAVLRAHGIQPHHDPRYAPFDAVLPSNDVISQHLSSRRPFEISMMYAAHQKAMGR